MSDIKKCSYCGKVLKDSDGGICPACMSKSKTFKNKLVMIDTKELRENASSDEAEIGVEEQPFPIPRRGEIISGLIPITDKIASGEIPPEEVPEIIGSIEENLSKAFAMIFSELEEVPVEVEDYEKIVAARLGDIEYLFHMGLNEIMLFSGSKDEGHLRYGVMLCEMGEEKYIELVKQINKDATGSPFMGDANIPENMAREFKMGILSETQFKEEVAKFKKATLDNIDSSRKELLEAFKKMEAYNGEDDKLIHEALNRFLQAQEQLSGIILNLHSPEELELAAEEFFEAFLEGEFDEDNEDEDEE
ncbi:MAG: hypothetical protein ACLFQV_08525 [Vulcanimicrobiota bacterium]